MIQKEKISYFANFYQQTLISPETLFCALLSDSSLKVA